MRAAASLCGTVRLTPRMPSAVNRANGVAEIWRRHVKGEIDAIDPERGVRRVVHRGRHRMLDRIAEDRGDAGPSAYAK